MEDLSRRLNKLETATAPAAKKKNYGRTQTAETHASKTPFVPNAQAKPFIHNNQNVQPMSLLRLCPPRDTPQKNIFQYKELETCSHLFLQRINSL